MDQLPSLQELANFRPCFSQACGLDYLPSLQELIYGNDINDMTGALVCANGYHVYHSLKLGKKAEILSAIESGRFSHIRAYAYSTAKAFMNDFDIKSNGLILKCGGRFDLQRVSPLTKSNDQAVFNFSLTGLFLPRRPDIDFAVN